MNDNDTRTAKERAEELAAEQWPKRERRADEAPTEIDIFWNGLRMGFSYGFLARDAEPATDPELRAAVNALKDAAKSINVIVSTGIDLSPEELDLIDACASGAAQGWLMAQAARIEGDPS